MELPPGDRDAISGMPSFGFTLILANERGLFGDERQFSCLEASFASWYACELAFAIGCARIPPAS